MDPLDNIPLHAIDAVVMDTETTGLNVDEARIVQIGAVAIRQGALFPDEKMDLLVDPQIPIPEEVVKIHGISDADVAGADIFAQAAELWNGFAGASLIVGHNIAFDLTILAAEHERSGLVWQRPRSLDTMILARIANASLPDFSLDMIAQWLNVEIGNRHTALGDAMATAEIFVKLVPLIREQGLRTLGEVERESRRFSDVFASHARAGWVEPIMPLEGVLPDGAISRIDSFAFQHRVTDVMSSPPQFASAGSSLREAARLLTDRSVSALFVKPEDNSGNTGIVTERDLMRALAGHDGNGDKTTLGEIMNQPLISVNEGAFVFEAIARMKRLGFRHLAVENDEGEIVGALTTGDLLRQRAEDAMILGDAIEYAEDGPALAQAWARMPTVAQSLHDEGLSALLITAVISQQLGALTRAAAVLAEQRMESEGLGKAPSKYCVLVLGSGGRGETLLAPDQDNALIFEHGEPGGPEDIWFAKMGGYMADTLNDVGIPYCTGEVMARNAQWRHSLDGWKKSIDRWVAHSSREDLWYVDIFYDFEAVYGDRTLALEIWKHAYQRAHRSPGFLRQLANVAVDFSPPVNLFGQVKLDRGRMDLKKQGLMALVSGARLLALRHDVEVHSTRRRLEGVRDRGGGNKDDIENVIEAHEIIMNLILTQQLQDIAEGIAPSNAVDTNTLTKAQRNGLRRALYQINVMTTMVGDPMIFG